MLNKRISTIFEITAYQYRKSLVSPKFYIGLAIGLIFVIRTTLGLRGFALSLDENVNILEPFILSANSSDTIFFALLGYILILSDAPFIDQRTLYTIIRSGKETWTSSIVLYILSSSFIYYVILLLGTCLCVADISFTSNMWSSPFYSLAAYSPVYAINDYGIVFSNIEFLMVSTPLIALVQSLLLPTAYLSLIGMIMFAINMNINKNLGSIVALIFHAIGYMILLESSFVNINYSLFVQSIPVFHGNGSQSITVYLSVAIFVIILMCLNIIAHILVRRCDFKEAISDKT